MWLENIMHMYILYSIWLYKLDLIYAIYDEMLWDDGII